MAFTVPRFLMDKGLGIARFAVQGRILLTRLFQQVLAELGMGRFIGYSGRVASLGDINDVLLEKLCTAYTSFIGMPMLLNYAGDFIYKNKDLREFFGKWEAANTFFKTRESQHWKTPVATPWTVYRNIVLARSGYNKEIYDQFNPRENLLAAERYKCCRLMQMQDEGNLTDLEKCLLAGRVLKDTAKPEAMFYMRSDLIPHISIFIGLDVCILISNVFTMNVYRKAIQVRKEREDIPAWMKYQSARISDATGLLSKQYFDTFGKLSFKIPYSDEFPHLVSLDTYGLKTTIALSKLLTELSIFEDWSRETPPPPVMVLATVDNWTFVFTTPPDMLSGYVEIWTWETQEPPSMAVVFYEPWGTPVPSMILMVNEPWTWATKPPPVMQQGYLEPWTQAS